MTDMTMIEARTEAGVGVSDVERSGAGETGPGETGLSKTGFGETGMPDMVEPQEIPSPSRSEAAICAMCVAVLRRVPSLGFVQGVEVSRRADASPNWTLKSLFPEPSRKQWDAAVTALDPWRSRYNLA